MVVVSNRDLRLTVDRMVSDGTPVNNSTVFVIQNLAIPIAANENCLVEITFLATTNAAGDMKFGLDYPAGCGIKWGHGFGQLGQYDQSNVVALSEEGGIANVLACPDGNIIGRITALVQNGATAGTLTLKMAQRLASVFDTLLLEGSCLVKMGLT